MSRLTKGDREKRQPGKSDEQLRRQYVSHFALYSTLIILVVGSVIGWFIADAIKLEMVEAYGLASAAEASIIVNQFITKGDLKKPLTSERYERFRRNVKKMTSGSGIVEIKLWRLDGTVLFSLDRNQVGTKPERSDQFKQAARGQPAFDFSDLSEPHHEEEREEHENLVELYYPLRLPGSNRIEGVTELYLSVAPIEREISHVLQYLGAGLGTLVLLLIGAAQVSSVMLRNRNDRLFSMATELERQTEELSRSQERWRAIADTAVDAIISMNLEGKITFWNPAAERIFGYPVQEAVGQKVSMLMPERFRRLHRQAVARIAVGEPSHTAGKILELAALRKNGNEFPITLSLAEAQTHESHYFIAILRDITERKKTENALRASEEQFRTIVSNSSECICKLDLEGRFEFMNAAGLKIFGLKDISEIVGVDAIELAEPEYRGQIQQELERAKEGETPRYQYESRTADGVKWFESVLSPQVDKDGRVVSLIRLSEEITERKEREERIKYAAMHDALTGLYNHGEFLNRLDQETSRAKRYGQAFSLLMFDLDHFKRVNDTYGHQAGDLVLQRTAETLQNCVRASDTVGRYGGEEFTVILPETTIDQAKSLGERIRRSVAEQAVIVTDDTSVRITISGGVANYPESATTAEGLIAHADAWLYVAKEQGRDRLMAT